MRKIITIEETEPNKFEISDNNPEQMTVISNGLISASNQVGRMLAGVMRSYGNSIYVLASTVGYGESGESMEFWSGSFWTDLDGAQRYTQEDIDQMSKFPGGPNDKDNNYTWVGIA